ATAQFDVARMRERATFGSVTITELADTLVREHGVPFKAAHAIASRLARSSGATARPTDELAAASREVTGREIRLTNEELARVLSPEYFVAVRRTWGGPAADVTAAAIAASRRKLADDTVDVGRRREGIRSSDVRRRQAVDAI